jgi:hypothetical protein
VVVGGQTVKPLPVTVGVTEPVVSETRVDTTGVVNETEPSGVVVIGISTVVSPEFVGVPSDTGTVDEDDGVETVVVVVVVGGQLIRLVPVAV